MNEINNDQPGQILLVGRDYGTNEQREQTPFIGEAGHLLNGLLSEAGIRRSKINITNLVNKQPAGNDFRRHSVKDVERGRAQLLDLVRKLRPSVVVAFGNEASHALIEGWPSKNGSAFRSYGIQERRGYIWAPRADIRGTQKIISALHPAGCLPFRDPSGIGSLLLLRDLERARDENNGTTNLIRPKRQVEVVSKSSARNIANRILASNFAACDIETHGPDQTACIGFATSIDQAFVFPPGTMHEAHRILLDPKMNLVFQNGQFDLYHLLSRDGLRVACGIDDTIIGWHCMWPEIAAQAQSKKGSKRTHKSLAFLSSIYTRDEWWKDYDFASNHEMYILNGRDCCITLDIWLQMNDDIDEMGVRQIYEHEKRLIWPCVDIQHRGLLVDQVERQSRLERILEREKGMLEQIRGMMEPRIEDRRDQLENPSLFYKQVTCKCCGNGKKKRERCWSCAGFDKSPSKADMVAKWDYIATDIPVRATPLMTPTASLSKAHLEEHCFKPCQMCDGLGSWEEFSFKPTSNQQVKEVLYNVLRLPKRYSKKKLSSDEETLKSLLGSLS